MLAPDLSLAYLAETARLAAEPEIDLSLLTQRWQLSHDEVRKGILDGDLVRGLQAAAVEGCPHQLVGTKDVPVLITLVSLQARSDVMGQGEEPLLLLPALVDTHGHLVPQATGPLIPSERIRADGTRNRTLCVCDLDTYRAHQMALKDLSLDAGWQASMSRALDLFHAICSLDEELLEEEGLIVVDDKATLMLADHPQFRSCVPRLLDEGAQGLRSKGVLTGPCRTLLEGARPAATEDAQDALPDDSLLAQKLICGATGHLVPLSPADRTVLSSFCAQSSGDTLVVHAPFGSNREAFTLTALATVLTESALRGEQVPRMCIVGTTETLQRFADALSAKPVFGQTALPSRWLPRIAKGSSTFGPATATRKILGPLQASALAFVADGEEAPTGPSVLLQHFGHALDGGAAQYADPWYVPQATTYFMDCVAHYLGRRFRSVGEAALALSERLRRIDQERSELIDAYAKVCRAATHMRERDELVAQLGLLRRAHGACRERLRFWELIERDNPPRRLVIGRMGQDQTKLIARHALPDEELAAHQTSVQGIIYAYRQELERIESEIDRLRDKSAILTRFVRAASPEGTRCSDIVGYLVSLCALNAPQTELLESIIDGHDTSLEHLDAVLDETVRMAEFWLAVHIFEARWLELSPRMRRTQELRRTDDVGDWRYWSLLAPFLLITPALAVGMLASGTDETEPSTSRHVDLMVLLDADQMPLATGVALLSQAERALLLGTQGSLAPMPAFGLTSAEIFCAQHLDEYDAIGAAQDGIVGHEATSLLHLAERRAGGSRSLLTVRGTRTEICDLRSALLPAELLSATGGGDPALTEERLQVAEMLPPLSHVLVPDSAWGQYGAGRRNRAEALSIMRWIGNHAEELVSLDVADSGSPLVLVAPYEAQADLLRKELSHQRASLARAVEVRWLARMEQRTWPIVVLCATCGPKNLGEDCMGGVASVLSLAASHARAAFVLFCGAPWVKSQDLAAMALMRRSLRVGRLFSVTRSREAAPAVVSEEARSRMALRSKPMSLTALLTRLSARGEVPEDMDVSAVNRALAAVGLIERCESPMGGRGWRPTAAGREVGILATKDRNRNPFCSYTPQAAPVIASIVSSMAPEETMSQVQEPPEETRADTESASDPVS